MSATGSGVIDPPRTEPDTGGEGRPSPAAIVSILDMAEQVRAAAAIRHWPELTDLFAFVVAELRDQLAAALARGDDR